MEYLSLKWDAICTKTNKTKPNQTNVIYRYTKYYREKKRERAKEEKESSMWTKIESVYGILGISEAYSGYFTLCAYGVEFLKYSNRICVQCTCICMCWLGLRSINFGCKREDTSEAINHDRTELTFPLGLSNLHFAFNTRLNFSSAQLKLDSTQVHIRIHIHIQISIQHTKTLKL